MLEVHGDVALVPGDQGGFDTREVLVERGAANARLLCYLGHGHRPQTMSGDQGCSRLENRVMHLAAVGLDGLMPELRDHVSIRPVDMLYWT
jgi:hypothetical protein